MAGETFESGDEAGAVPPGVAFWKKEKMDFCLLAEEEGGGFTARAGVRTGVAFSPAMMEMIDGWLL